VRTGAAFRLLQVLAAALALLGAGVLGARIAQSAPPGSSGGGTGAAALDVPGVRSIVAQYIMDHPETIVAALDAQQAQQALQRQSQVSIAIRQHRAELLADAGSPAMGDPKGDVTVVEFFDFRCPYCKKTAPLLEHLVARERRVRIVFKNLPVLGPESMYAARLGLAAARRGRFAEFYKTIFAQVPAHGDRGAIDGAVRNMSLNPAALYAASKTPEIDAAVQRDLRLAESLGITGTPALVVGDQVLPGAPTAQELDAAIRGARQTRQR
jgi:protein-disulfide isomerase